MSTRQSDIAYSFTYRAREVKILAGWVAAGESGSVVGLLGCGRSNLLKFLCHRPEVFQSYLPQLNRSTVLIPVDLNIPPANNLSTLYRVILRSFYRFRDQFEEELQQTITKLYETNRAEQDPFLTQSALQDLLLLCKANKIQVVLILNRFDSFCESATRRMVNTLRSLRDDFKDTLCYIVGMTQETAYLPDPTVLGEMYELLDNYVCWVGAMNDDDAKNVIARATYTAPVAPSEEDVSTMVALTGNFPALLKATCLWWSSVENKPDRSDWLTVLLSERSIQHRLTRVWNGLTQEEQFILFELQKLQIISIEKAMKDFFKQHGGILTRLVEKGVCRPTETGWDIAGDLLAAYIANVKGRSRGKIWLDEATGEIYQGQTLVKNLTSLELAVLDFLVRNPRLRHTKTDLIISTWPDELRREGVTDNSLYQIISTIRREIEPIPSKPSYLVTWRGKPEGGYQFFPEGRPA